MDVFSNLFALMRHSSASFSFSRFILLGPALGVVLPPLLRLVGEVDCFTLVRREELAPCAAGVVKVLVGVR